MIRLKLYLLVIYNVLSIVFADLLLIFSILCAPFWPLKHVAVIPNLTSCSQSSHPRVMADESEISLEETNRIRASLGLKPIVIDAEQSTNKSAQASATVNGGGGGSKEEISLEETNRIRISLGLKPITETTTTDNVSSSSLSAEDQDRIARENWLQKYEEERRQANEDRLRKKIQASRERAETRRRLEGKGLGEDGEMDPDLVSTKSWLKKLKQQKKKAVLSHLDEQEEEGEQKEEYSTKDLTGLKVGHKLSDIQGLTRDTILTLKDTSVLDEEGDELISTALEEKQKLEENIRNKKGLRKHSDQDEDGKTSILNRYDNDDEKDDFFLLDGAEALPSRATELKTPVPKSVMTRTSLNFEDDMDLIISSDYQEAKPAKLKKPKKRKATAQAPQARKRIRDDDEVVVSNGDIENIDDDVDLQAMLALNRRKVQKTRRLLTPEEIAEQMQKDKDEEDRTKPKEGIVISSTNDFLTSVKQASLRLSTEPEEDEAEKAGMELQPVSATEEKAKVENAEALLVAQEPSISGGMGDALRLLQSRGMVKKKTAEELELERQKQEQRDWTTKMRKERLLREVDLQRQREQDRLSGKYDTLSLKEREQVAVRENRERDLLEAREAQKRFENYRPQVNLEYRDELGRKLNEREAYKHLSHQFHGKGPGKGKIDKQLKQMAEESKSEAVSIFDAGVNNDVENRKKAGIRLQ